MCLRAPANIMTCIQAVDEPTFNADRHSTSRAEGTVNQLVNARMNKRRQMRWSPRGAHRVLQVRVAVLDERFGHQAIQLTNGLNFGK